jgi:hypothetical protein
MTGVVAVIPKKQFLSATGVPLVDGTVTVYLAGTVTPTNTWQDADLSVLNTNPIELDARGECLLWLDQALTYKFVLKNAAGVEQWTVDDVPGANSLSTITFLQAGTGAVTRTALEKAREWVSVTDFPDASTAVTGTPGGGTILVPNGETATLPASYPDVVFDYLGPNISANVFQMSGETTRTAKRVLRGMNAGSHSGDEESLLCIESRPVGSGANGPTNADYGLTLSMLKKDFDTTAVVGEIDALNIALRQGGATSDGCAILTNQATYGTGFIASLETQTSIISVSTVTHQIQAQVAACDNVNGSYVGFFTSAKTGALSAAYQANSDSPSTWTHLFMGKENNVEKFSVTGGGDILGGNLHLNNAAASVAAGISLGSTTAASATAGAGALPAGPAGFLIFYEQGTKRKIPYYND